MENKHYVDVFIDSRAKRKHRIDLPNDIAIQVLGILTIVFAGSIGLVSGIIVLNMSGRSLNLYHNSPEDYNASSYSRVNIGRICAIIGLVITVMALVFIGIVIIYAMGHGQSRI